MDLRMNVMLGLLPGGIEAGERMGQTRANAAAVLPKMSAKDRADFEAIGVVFGEPVEGDDLFVHATLPAGWKKEATEHAMWSKLLDDKGRTRAMIFYKAAYYDRRADASLSGRYAIESYDPKRRKGLEQAHVIDNGVVPPATLFSTKLEQEPKEKPWELSERHNAECCAWLDANRPNWKDRVAAWNEP